MQNLYVYIIAVVLVAIFLLYHELKRANRKRLPLRILAVITASAALLFFIVPLKYEETLTTDPNTMNILTAGVIPASLGKEIYYTSDSSVLKQVGKDKVTYIPDLLYNLAGHPEVNGLNVYGYGLPEQTLNELDDKVVYFKPAETPDGIVFCNWARILPASEVLRVQGTYNNTKDAPVRLLLEGLGTKMDSLIIPAKQQLTFDLTAQPRQTGRAIYRLLAMQGDKEIGSSDIPFEVIERPTVKVLVLAASPDFEFKFLRNWLHDHNYPAFFRTRISKDKFSTEQVNLESTESANITAATFKKYDLVIADDEELADLGALNGALQQELNNGLGLLIRLSEAKALSNFSQTFKLSATQDSITTTVIPVLEAEKLKPVPIDQPLYIGQKSTQLPLVADTRGRILASTALRGNGRVTATTLPATYNWVLNASAADYASYWSALINNTARKTSQEFSWQIAPALPLRGEQVELIFQEVMDKNPPQVMLNGRALNTQQHLVLPFYWQASHQATNGGWQTFSTTGGHKQAIYIFKSDDWKSVKAYERLKLNMDYQQKQVKERIPDEKTSKQIEKTVSRWIFFAFFLISMGFLWFETKILQ